MIFGGRVWVLELVGSSWVACWVGALYEVSGLECCGLAVMVSGWLFWGPSAACSKFDVGGHHVEFLAFFFS